MFAKFNQPTFTWQARQLFFVKGFGSPNLENSRRGESHVDLGFKTEIRIKEAKINSAKPTVIDSDRMQGRRKLKEKQIFAHVITQ